MQAGDLRCTVDIYEPETTTNALGEDAETGLKVSKQGVKAQIIPLTGSNREVGGDSYATTVTHKIRIRKGAATLTTDSVIVYNNQRFDVRYWEPVYKNDRYMEIMTVLEVSV